MLGIGERPSPTVPCCIHPYRDVVKNERERMVNAANYELSRREFKVRYLKREGDVIVKIKC